MKVTLEKSDKLDRGERLIVVDGVTWGRTIVSHHGVHGDKHMFHQEHGETIGNVSSKGGFFYEVSVRTTKRRRWLASDEWRPTYEMVLEKVIELIDAGRLRHPDVVKQEQNELRERMRQNEARRDRKEHAQFEAKALEALDGVPDDVAAPLVAKVVAAMRWAQMWRLEP